MTALSIDLTSTVENWYTEITRCASSAQFEVSVTDDDALIDVTLLIERPQTNNERRRGKFVRPIFDELDVEQSMTVSQFSRDVVLPTPCSCGCGRLADGLYDGRSKFCLDLAWYQAQRGAS